MRTRLTRAPADQLWRSGRALLRSEGMRAERDFLQHGTTSVLRHSLAVALTCLRIAKALRWPVDADALTRGALLHDYFLYDWHEADPSHAWHGFTHARRAADNAARDFAVGATERDMILHHMFPLNPAPPRSREAWILCCADKLCSLRETVRGFAARRAAGRNRPA